MQQELAAQRRTLGKVDELRETIDREGFGMLMRIALERGNKARLDLEMGICGVCGDQPRAAWGPPATGPCSAATAHLPAAMVSSMAMRFHTIPS